MASEKKKLPSVAMQTLQGSFLALVNGGPLAITKDFFSAPVSASGSSGAGVSLVFDAEQDYFRVELGDAEARKVYANALHYLFSEGCSAMTEVKRQLVQDDDQIPLFNAVADSFNMQCKELSKVPELKGYEFEKLVLEK